MKTYSTFVLENTSFLTAIKVLSCRNSMLTHFSHLCVFCSWDNIHLRARRSPHHIYLATQWPAEHTGRPAGSGLQHTAEGGHSGQGRECQGTGRLSGAAHSKLPPSGYLRKGWNDWWMWKSTPSYIQSDKSPEKTQKVKGGFGSSWTGKVTKRRMEWGCRELTG